MTASPRVKVCGLMRAPDAVAAAEAGAHYGGVILSPGHRRSVGLQDASRILGGSPLRRVGVFVDADVGTILEAVERVELDVVQLHGDESPDLARQLRKRGVPAIWKAVRVRSAGDLTDAADRYGAAIDGLLLDAWSADSHGGTGTTFPWRTVVGSRGALPGDIDLILAGGLGPANVARAIAILLPTVVDVSSGVEESPGTKDHRLIRAFVDAARDPARSN